MLNQGGGYTAAKNVSKKSIKIIVFSGLAFIVARSFWVTQSVTRKQDSAKYCSKECHNASMRDYVQIVCIGCAKEVSTPRSDVERGRGKYCSAECYNKHINAKVVASCEQCGNEFVTHKSNVSAGGGRFCSRDCYTKYLRANGQDWYKEHSDSTLVSSCVRCGKEFKVRPKQKRRFCSFTCQLLYRGETYIEELIRKELERRGLNFDTQVQIGKFNVDFCLLNEKKIIECDGEYWHNLPGAQARDRYKDIYLFQKGYKVFRFTESEIRSAARGCVDRVLRG